MERGGLESMTDSAGLCLQDLVGGGGGGSGSQSDHLHNHHPLHDSVAAAVSVSSAITGLMTGTGGAGLGHLHHSSHDISGHHHHSVVPHTPSLHEPLEKLKSKSILSKYHFVRMRKNIIGSSRVTHKSKG